MNIKENKKALKASIRKYRRTVKLLEDNLGEAIEHREGERISISILGETFVSYEWYVSGKRIPFGTEECPLCILYYRDNCVGCCIRADTDKCGCEGTPYFKYQDNVMYSKKVGKLLLNSARKELEYLEGLYERLRGSKIDMQKIVDANEKLVKELKDNAIRGE